VFLEHSFDELLFVGAFVRLLLRLDPVVIAAFCQIDDVEQVDDWILLP
jgi:hypothetical protein